MNELALFAGAGGGLLASNILGHNIVCAVERDAYCVEVLMQRQNDGILQPFPVWDDIRTFDGAPWRGTVDLVSGGFPCQAFSHAARGRNVAAKNLWGEMRRVVNEVRPTFVFAENVSMHAILSAAEDLRHDGYGTEYMALSAKDVGADHRRARYWLLAYAYDGCKLFRPEYAEARGVQELRGGVWETYSGEFRVPDGVAFRVDRLKAAGNGQVPLVAAIAFSALMRRVKNNTTKMERP